MKVTGLLFKMSIFGSNTGGISYKTIFEVSGTIVVSIFLSDNAMFFVKEIFVDLLIVSDTELSRKLVTEPITINITPLN